MFAFYFIFNYSVSIVTEGAVSGFGWVNCFYPFPSGSTENLAAVTTPLRYREFGHPSFYLHQGTRGVHDQCTAIANVQQSSNKTDKPDLVSGKTILHSIVNFQLT